MQKSATESESCQNLLVAILVRASEIVQQLAPTSYHTHESSARGNILLVRRKMVSKMRNPPREDRDLYIGTAGVTIMQL